MTLRLTITWEFQSHDIYIQINLDNNASDVYRFSTIDKNENLSHHDINVIGMAFAHAHVASSPSPFYQESPPWTHCVLAPSSYRPCFPLTPWYWNVLSSGIKTFFLVVLKYFYCGIEKIQACGWFSNSYCPFQHSTFPTLICLQQSSLSRFKKDNFYIFDLHWLFESDHDLE